MPAQTTGPTSHSYYSQRLRLHYVDWANEGAPPLLLVHGGRDHCRNWDWVAGALRQDYHIIAPDLRGHGDSQWLIGGSYSIPGFVYDVAHLVHQTRIAPMPIIAHSLGGMISLQYAGTYPEQVSKLVVIEGLGMSPQMVAERAKQTVPERVADWVEDLRELSGRAPRRYDSLEDAFARMREANPHLTPAQARHLTVHGANQNEDGSYGWKFDNYVRPWPPHGLAEAEIHALWANITCPVLLIRGNESWASDPAKDGRAKHFKNVTCVNIDGAGHWVHHDKLDEFLGLVRDFLAD